MERTVPLSNLARFARVVDRPESAINLAEAALLIAEDAYPRLDTDAYLRRMDELAEPLADRVRPDSSLLETVEALNGHLFGDVGFRGNEKEYYDPRNSYLNEVLDRKLGIPITLSIVTIEVAARNGLRLDGVGFPGHFLVKCPATGGLAGDLFVDPFNGGDILTTQECMA